MKIEIPENPYYETNVFYIRDLVSFIRQLDREPFSIERKFAELDSFTKELQNENPPTRAESQKILYDYTNYLLKLKV